MTPILTISLLKWCQTVLTRRSLCLCYPPAQDLYYGTRITRIGQANNARLFRMAPNVNFFHSECQRFDLEWQGFLIFMNIHTDKHSLLYIFCIYVYVDGIMRWKRRNVDAIFAKVFVCIVLGFKSDAV